MNEMDWVAECAFLDRAAGLNGRMRQFGYDTACFLRYCRMQQSIAPHDTKTYIQHIVDDLIKDCTLEFGPFVRIVCKPDSLRVQVYEGKLDWQDKASFPQDALEAATAAAKKERQSLLEGE